MMDKIISVLIGFTFFFSGKLPDCQECIEKDTIPYKKIEQAVSGPLDSIRIAKRKELDSLRNIHDSVKETLDSLTAKKFVGRIDSFKTVNKKMHKVFWWYYIDKWGNVNYSNTTAE